MKQVLLLTILVGLRVLSIAQIGNPAPDFTATDVYGHTHHLYEYLEQGKVVVLDFFFTTCGPCQFYSPQVNLAYEKYGCNTANVVFIAIDYGDTDAMVETYDAAYAIKFPSISGVEGGGNAIVSSYGVIGFPTFYVIDGSKTIIEEIDPPTLQVFDFRFGQHGILPADCEPLGVEEATTPQAFRLFPNPIQDGLLTVEWPEGNMGVMEIFDVAGKLVWTESFGTSSRPTRIELGWLRPGVYWVKWNNGTCQKLIKL
ncbi:MAG: redoxin domain-containing protein [Lewinellaceae bacterium]|nr:redoxin domain-containing protein [Lewinellaceae bacterium]